MDNEKRVAEELMNMTACDDCGLLFPLWFRGFMTEKSQLSHKFRGADGEVLGLCLDCYHKREEALEGET